MVNVNDKMVTNHPIHLLTSDKLLILHLNFWDGIVQWFPVKTPGQDGCKFLLW